MRNVFEILILMVLFGYSVTQLTAQENTHNPSYYLVDSLNTNEYGASDRALLDSLLKKFHSENTDTAKLAVLGNLIEGMNHDDWFKYNQFAMLFAKEIMRKESSRKTKNFCHKTIAELKFNKGYWNEVNGKHLEAIQYFKDAMKDYQALKDTISIITCYNNIAYMYKDLGDFKDAIYNLTLAYKYAKLINNIKEQIDVLNMMVELYQIQENLEKQLQLLFYTLKLSEKNDYQIGISQASNNIGIFYYKQKDYHRAINYLEQSLKATTKDQEQLIAHAYNNLGVLYSKIEDYKSALLYHHKSLSLRKTFNSKKDEAESYHNIASIYHGRAKLDSALLYYQLSMNIKEEINNIHSMAQTLSNLGEVYNLLDKPLKALKCGKKALKIAKSTSDKNSEIFSYLTISNAYSLQNDYKNSLKYYKLHVALNDSIFNQERLIAMNELEAQYISDKKQQEISLLNEKNKVQALELKQKNGLLWGGTIGLIAILIITLLTLALYRIKANKKESEFLKKQLELKQQALRAQMNPHFLFNSLNSIQRIYVEGNMMLANDYMADFSSLLRSILNNSDKERISLQEDLQMLELYLSMEKVRTDGQINYVLNLDEKLNASNVLVPPMVIQPFVENAIWHGILPAKRTGNINVAITYLSEELINCTVTDDGIGIETNRKNKNTSHISKGISLATKRLGKKGSVKEEQLETGGTKITLQIPMI